MSGLLLRLEPRSRAASLEPGLAARLADPAWTLARQWVLGELDGEDAGSPVLARASFDHFALPRAEVNRQSVKLDPREDLLDPIAEQTRLAPPWPYHERLTQGRALYRALIEAGEDRYAQGLLQDYPLPPLEKAAAKADPAAAALSAIAAGRVPDGGKVHAVASQPGTSFVWPTKPANILKAWLEALLPRQAASGWQTERLSHAFALTETAGQFTLSAEDHRGGDLDWHSFRYASALPPQARPARQTAIEQVPTSIRFPGMPNPRYWTFEDGQVDLGAVTAQPADLARMALLQFAFAYGNDSFQLPVELPVGDLTRVSGLSVLDTFGIETAIGPAARSDTPSRAAWTVFGLSGGVPDGALFVPPIARGELQGEPVEIAELLRDEMANLVWAVERRIEGESGASLDRAEALQRAAPIPQEPPVETDLRYVLQSTLPSNWYPMELESTPRRQLRLTTLAASGAGPLGHLLPAIGEHLNEEEIARDGIRLLRRAVLARTASGRLIVWARNERHIGRGEANGGLLFDRTTRTADGGP
ncbi:MAG: hypothetical protein WAV95_17045 [Azonexus sp.]